MVAFSKFSFPPIDYLVSYPPTKTDDGSEQIPSNGVKNAKRVYYSHNCYYNAHHNRKNYQPYNNLKPVYGSLIINGVPIFGRGGKDMRDFADRQSSHCWLEDETGAVYDYLYKGYYDNQLTAPKNDCYTEWEIVGISKKELKEEGIEFIPANKQTQKRIADYVKEKYESRWITNLVINRLKCGWKLEDIAIDYNAFQ
jgi:hypothetical protein